MKLERIIPAHKLTIKIKQYKENFSTMTPRWRELRPDMKMECYWCKNNFKDGEQISIAIPEKHKNILLCKDCIKLVKDSENI